MHISLTSELETKIRAEVESGLYNIASEVIHEALRFMEQNGQKQGFSVNGQSTIFLTR